MLWLCLLLFLADTSSFDLKFRQGLAALNRNDLPAAQSNLEQASRLQPANPQVWLALAQTYLRSGKKPLAESAAAKAETAAPGDPAVLHGLALYYAETGEFAKAAQYEVRYAGKVPADRDAGPRAASWYIQGGQPKTAIPILEKALEQQNRAELRNLLGKALEADGRVEEALEAYREAVRLNRFQESYHFDLGYALLRRQRFPDAIDVLEASRKVFAKSAQLELALGVAYYGQRRFPEAVNAFLQTIAIDPRPEQPYVFLTRMIDQLGERLPEFAQRASVLVRARPDHYLAQYVYAKVLIAQSAEGPAAEEALRKSIAAKSDFPDSHIELGLLLERKRDLPGAEKEFERAAMLSPNDPIPHYRLARIYARQNKDDQARRELELHRKLTAGETK